MKEIKIGLLLILIVFTYHPVFSKLIIILSEIHVLLTPDREHRKAFGKVPIIEFRRAKSLKNILVRAKVVPLEKKEGMFKTIHR